MIAALGGVFVIILLLLSVSALFSAAETALTAASRGRMHQLEKDGDKAAGRVNRLLEDRESMIGAVLLGYNLINILTSALATYFVEKVVQGPLGVVIATAVMTALVLVYVEVLPKTLAITRPDDLARGLSAFILLCVRVLDPVVDAIQWIVRRTLNLFGISVDMKADVFAAHEEIRGAIEYHHEEGRSASSMAMALRWTMTSETSMAERSSTAPSMRRSRLSTAPSS